MNKEQSKRQIIRNRSRDLLQIGGDQGMEGRGERGAEDDKKQRCVLYMEQLPRRKVRVVYYKHVLTKLKIELSKNKNKNRTAV